MATIKTTIDSVQLSSQTAKAGQTITVTVQAHDNTWGSILIRYPTWQDVMDNLPTWQDVLDF